MNRDFLKDLGLDDGHIEQIMAEHGKTVNALKEEKDGLDQERQSVLRERDQLKEEMKDRDKQLDDLRDKAQDHESLQATIDQLKLENKQKEEQYQEQMKEQKFSYELDKQLQQSGVINPKAVHGLLNKDHLSLTEDGNIAGLHEQVEALRESDWYLFSDKQQQQPPSYTPGSDQKGNGTPPASDPKERGKLRALEHLGKLEETKEG